MGSKVLGSHTGVTCHTASPFAPSLMKWTRKVCNKILLILPESNPGLLFFRTTGESAWREATEFTG
jgi:hypothetical protein